MQIQNSIHPRQEIYPDSWDIPQVLWFHLGTGKKAKLQHQWSLDAYSYRFQSNSIMITLPDWENTNLIIAIMYIGKTSGILNYITVLLVFKIDLKYFCQIQKWEHNDIIQIVSKRKKMSHCLIAGKLIKISSYMYDVTRPSCIDDICHLALASHMCSYHSGAHPQIKIAGPTQKLQLSQWIPATSNRHLFQASLRFILDLLLWSLDELRLDAIQLRWKHLTTKHLMVRSHGQQVPSVSTIYNKNHKFMSCILAKKSETKYHEFSLISLICLV